jgi:hypothetical protein
MRTFKKILLFSFIISSFLRVLEIKASSHDFPEAIDLQILNGEYRHIRGLSVGYKQIISPNDDRKDIGNNYKSIGKFSLNGVRNTLGVSIYRNDDCVQSCHLTLRDKYVKINFNQSAFVHGEDIYQPVSKEGRASNLVIVPNAVRFNFKQKNDEVLFIYMNKW